MTSDIFDLINKILITRLPSINCFQITLFTQIFDEKKNCWQYTHNQM